MLTPRQVELIERWRALPARDRVAALSYIHLRRQEAHTDREIAEMMGYETAGAPDLQAAASLAISVLEALGDAEP